MKASTHKNIQQNCTSQLEYLFIISIELNVFGLVYTVTKKVLNSFHRNEGTSKACSKTGVIVFACEKESKSRCGRRKEHIISRGIVNALCSTILFGFAMDILYSTQVIGYPFVGITRRVQVGISSLISLSIFNLLLTLTTGNTRKGKIHSVCKHIVAICTLMTSLYFDENSLSGVLGMVITGSIFIDELKVIVQTYCETRREWFNAFSLFHLGVNFLCQLFLPIVIVIITLIHTKQRFFDIDPIVQTMFFLSATFFFWHNVWCLRKITYSYMAERAKVYIIRATQERPEDSTPTNIFSEWGKKVYRTTFVKQVQQTKSAKSETKEEEFTEGIEWTSIDLNSDF